MILQKHKKDANEHKSPWESGHIPTQVYTSTTLTTTIITRNCCLMPLTVIIKSDQRK